MKIATSSLLDRHAIAVLLVTFYITTVVTRLMILRMVLVSRNRTTNTIVSSATRVTLSTVIFVRCSVLWRAVILELAF